MLKFARQQEDQEDRDDIGCNSNDDSDDDNSAIPFEWGSVAPDDITVGGLINVDDLITDNNPNFKATERRMRFTFTEKARKLGTSQETILQIIEGVYQHLLRSILQGGHRRGWVQVGLDKV